MHPPATAEERCWPSAGVLSVAAPWPACLPACTHVQVAPVLRFLDVGYNANITIQDVGPPERVISGFAPELFGVPLGDDDVKATRTFTRGGAMYYNW